MAFARPAGRSRSSRSSVACSLTFQPVRTNSVASQSSSSGCDGGSPCEPKSSAGLHEAGAEIHLPEPIHRDPRRERVRRIAPAIEQAPDGSWENPPAWEAGSPGLPGVTALAGLIVRSREAGRASRAASAFPPSPSRSEACRRTARAAAAAVVQLLERFADLGRSGLVCRETRARILSASALVR